MAVCRLTGTIGKLVKCHLIPKALTRPEVPGEPFTEFGHGLRPKKVFSSWYDQTLVTREGEDLLADLDDWAISFMRKKRLVWSGWGPVVSMERDFTIIPNTFWGTRELQVENPAKLRLFFLSLLWRAAHSQRPGFKDIVLPENDLGLLKELLLTGNAGEPDFYPTSLTQLYTIGEVHNHTPIWQKKVIPAIDDLPEHEIEFVRFYFDGLIVHMNSTGQGDGPVYVGTENRLIITGVPYSNSLQSEIFEDLKRGMLESTAGRQQDLGAWRAASHSVVKAV